MCATKPELAARMVARFLDAGHRAAWVAGDEVYGGNPTLRTTLEERGTGSVLAVACSHDVTTGAGKFRADTLAAKVPERAWQKLSAGAGAKGHRFYDWAVIDPTDLTDPRPGSRQLLIRRNRSTGELAYYRIYSPAPVPLTTLVRVAGSRWRVETAYAELKSTILGGRVLRARTPDGVEQEVWALLTVYQALRTAMTDATDSVPGTDPDRAGFTTALAAARDQLVLAADVTPGTEIDLVGTIGRHILARLLPARRVRTKNRIVKRAISKYNARGPAIDRTTYRATISITMLTNGP